MSGGTRKYLFISSSLHRPFGGCFLLHAAKLVEVGRNIAVLSLGEGSCDDDLPDQAPKLVKFVDTAWCLRWRWTVLRRGANSSAPSLDEGGSAEVVKLVGRPEWQRHLKRLSHEGGPRKKSTDTVVGPGGHLLWASAPPSGCRLQKSDADEMGET